MKINGYVSRGWLGVQTADVDETIAERLDLEDAAGALVAHVVDNTPAQEAGVEQHDVIIAWNGEEIAGKDDLLRAVGKTKANSEVSVTLLRDGQSHELTVTVGRRPRQLNR